METLLPHPMKAAHTFSQSVKTPAFCQISRAAMGLPLSRVAAGIPAWEMP